MRTISSRGRPCRHVCIENFFCGEVAEEIQRDFSAFDIAKKINEFETDGQKAVYGNLSQISPFYARLTEYLNSAEHADIISLISDIAGLRRGGEAIYGGTPDNINGAGLDAHFYFNYDDVTGEHRRFNLFVYFNKECGDDWGGQFELQTSTVPPEFDTSGAYPDASDLTGLYESSTCTR